jgi:LmbE family N-acetylglucosaminyl deacetylase
MLVQDHLTVDHLATNPQAVAVANLDARAIKKSGSSRAPGNWKATLMRETNLALGALFVATMVAALVLSLSAIAGRQPQSKAERLKIVVFGAHPDDPESGAGGLIASLRRQEHEVIVAYGTCFRGQRRFFGRPEAEIRRAEATSACQILGASSKFFPYAHENLTADPETVRAVATWLGEVKPDIVMTHWPLDTHPNHHAVSSLVWQCYERHGGWNLYFFEVLTNRQSIGFKPELYLDIEPVRDIKHTALSAHKSQNPDEIWRDHEEMHRVRGAECGRRFAEAYTLVEAKPGCPLLPIGFLKKR